MTNAEIDELVREQYSESRRTPPRHYPVGTRVCLTDRGKRIWPNLPAEGIVTDIRLPKSKGRWENIAVHGKYWHAGWWVAVPV
jgi:hypothetical protein